MTRANQEPLRLTDAPTHEVSLRQYVLISDFDEELNRERKATDNWFAQLRKTKPSNLRIDKNSEFFDLYGRLEGTYETYQRERKEKTALGLPEIPEESFLAMLFLFPLIHNKSPSSYVDTDLCSVAVTFEAKKSQKVSIVTKTPRLLYLHKVGTVGNIPLPFSFSSILQLPSASYLERLEKILS